MTLFRANTKPERNLTAVAKYKVFEVVTKFKLMYTKLPSYLFVLFIYFINLYTVALLHLHYLFI